MPRRRNRAGLARLSAALLAVLVVAGCATPQVDRVLESPAGLKPRAEIASVPFYPQEEDQCGPAALSMALTASGVNVSPGALVSEVFAPERRGSLPSDMVAAARRHGRLAYPVSNMADLLAEAAGGHPAVVLQDLGVPGFRLWHYAVLVGYDLRQETLVLRSGADARKTTSLRDFERSWKPGGYWAILVLPPADLPVRADEKKFLEAAVGLEHAKQWNAAAQAYGAALRRWPESLGAAIGLGNARYAVGDLGGAAEAFGEAARRHPDSGAAFNNWADVLSRLNRKPEAEAAAEKAVALGGAQAETFRVTLQEIRAR